MRYWRHYPKFLQVLLLMLMIFTLASFSSVVAGLLLKPLFGVNLQDLTNVTTASDSKLISAAQFVQGLISLFTFLLSALLFSYLTHPAPLSYLGIRAPKRSVQWAIVALLLVSFMPLVNQLGTWLQQIDLGTAAKASLASNQEMTHALMRGTSTGDLFVHLLLFAVLPAIGEEFLFRGVLMRFSYNNSGNIHFAILLSAALFSLAHGSLYNFFPIMLMGILLGYIYYLTGSIWFSVLAHFLNNALAAIGLFMINKHFITEEAGKGENFPWYILLTAIVLFVFSLLLLRKNATPLPADWSNDFKEEQS